MSKLRLILERQNTDLKQTLGTMYVVNDADRIQFSCWSLELPDLDNKSNISRIPAGNYNISKRWSKKFGHHMIVKNVEGRKYILIHGGNTYLDTRGCILVGNDLAYVNEDSHIDVINSKKTLADILDLIEETTTLMIVENEHEEESSTLIQSKS